MPTVFFPWMGTLRKGKKDWHREPGMTRAVSLAWRMGWSFPRSDKVVFHLFPVPFAPSFSLVSWSFTDLAFFVEQGGCGGWNDGEKRKMKHTTEKKEGEAEAHPVWRMGSHADVLLKNAHNRPAPMIRVKVGLRLASQGVGCVIHPLFSLDRTSSTWLYNRSWDVMVRKSGEESRSVPSEGRKERRRKIEFLLWAGKFLLSVLAMFHFFSCFLRGGPSESLHGFTPFVRIAGLFSTPLEVCQKKSRES